MGNAMKRLPDAELEVMMIIWKADGPVSSAYIQERLRETHTWVLPTTLGFLSRLAERGFVSCEKKGRGNLYTALVSENDYLENESRSFLERLCGNSVKTFVSSLYHSQAINDEDLAELRRFIDATAKKEEEP